MTTNAVPPVGSAWTAQALEDSFVLVAQTFEETLRGMTYLDTRLRAVEKAVKKVGRKKFVFGVAVGVAVAPVVRRRIVKQWKNISDPDMLSKKLEKIVYGDEGYKRPSRTRNPDPTVDVSPPKGAYEGRL